VGTNVSSCHSTQPAASSYDKRQAAPDRGRIFNLNNLCLILGVTSLSALEAQSFFEVDNREQLPQPSRFLFIIIIFREERGRKGLLGKKGKKKKRFFLKAMLYFCCIFKSCFSARI
jgi:hypothetical protein